MSANHRFIKFWPQDWQNDVALNSCTISARGLWITLICVMHDADPYGHLVVNGKTLTTQHIARISRVSEKEATKLLAELEEAGVFSRTDDGVIYSRRMVRDWQYEIKHRTFGKQGGNPSLKPAPAGTTPKESRVVRLKPDKNPRIFRRVFEAADGKCQICGVGLTRETPYAANSYQMDHIVEIKNGGTNDPENLRAVCRRCNMSRNLIPHADDPITVTPDDPVKGSSERRDMFLESESESEAEVPPKPPVTGGRVCEGGFDEFWKRYPRKDDIGHARKAWARAVRKSPAADILAGLERYRFSEIQRYQPLPATWLNGERWLSPAEDDFDPVLRAVGLSPEDFENCEPQPGMLLQ